METTPDGNQKKSKHFFWFVLGWVMLLLMALMASLDGSFFYIFLSLACVFFFLGYWNSPRRTSMFGKEKSQARHSANEAREHYREQARTMSSPVSHATNSRKIAWIASAFIGFVFMVIILPIIFSSDDTSSQDDTMLGTQYLEMGQCDSAYVLYKRAMRKDAENIDAITGYGNAVWCLGNIDSARVMFIKALALEPENEFARYRRAGVYADTQQYDLALNELRSLLKEIPEYYNAMYLMGDVYYNQKNFVEALPWYEKAYSNGIRNRWICHLMAFLYEQKNQNDKAIPLYKESLSYDSSNVAVYIRLGELLPGREGEFFRQRGAQMNQ